MGDFNGSGTQRRGDAERSAALLRKVGRELRAAREQSGLSLAAVAEIIGWQKSALSKVEIGNPHGRHTNLRGLDQPQASRWHSLMSTKSLSCLLIALSITILSNVKCYGQISPFDGGFMTQNLTDTDINLLFATAKQLNETKGVQTGDKRMWSNAKSGNAGTVSVTRVFQSEGLSCHGLRYDLAQTPKRPAQTYTADWCKTASGEWKILS